MVWTRNYDGRVDWLVEGGGGLGSSAVGPNGARACACNASATAGRFLWCAAFVVHRSPMLNWFSDGCPDN